nr:unnamed protein product [Callosobruchus analis]
MKYKIPRATLQFRRSKFKKKTSPGPTPYLTSEEELLLVDWIINCSKKGFPRRKEDIQLSVKSFLDKLPEILLLGISVQVKLGTNHFS